MIDSLSYTQASASSLQATPLLPQLVAAITAFVTQCTHAQPSLDYLQAQVALVNSTVLVLDPNTLVRATPVGPRV